MRRAVLSDLDVVKSITADAYSEFQAAINMVPMPVSEDYRPRVERGEVWLRDEGDAPIALIVLEDHPDHLCIFSVAVRAAHQGKGLGSQLLAFADRKAAERGYREIRLYTNGLMHRQMKLYERHGFVKTNSRDHPLLKGHLLVDMTKRLTGD